MSFMLQTLNKGRITAGYFSAYTQEVRIGDFSIPTPDFCNFVAALATGERSLDVLTTSEYCIKVKWNPNKRVVTLGRYEIAGEEFGIFSDYVFNGGIMGWRPDQPGWKPDFVKAAINYILERKSDAQNSSYLRLVRQKHLLNLEDLV